MHTKSGVCGQGIGREKRVSCVPANMSGMFDDGRGMVAVLQSCTKGRRGGRHIALPSTVISYG